MKERLNHHRNPGSAFEVERKSGWYLYRDARTPDGGRILLAADLSQQKEKEAELQRALQELITANEAKDSFLSNMSHELRTPLNAINGFSEIMEQEVFGPLNDQYRTYAGHISQSGKHLQRLVTDMLDIARIETGKLEIVPEQVDIAKLIEECSRMEQDKLEEKNLRFSHQVPDNLPHLFADPIRIRQVLLNLLDNAIKFTDGGGEIEIRARQGDDGAITLAVRDSGIGMAPEHIGSPCRNLAKSAPVISRHMMG